MIVDCLSVECRACGPDGLDADRLSLAPARALALARLWLLVLLVRREAVLYPLHCSLSRLGRL